ncbi:protein antagonist of like heterochromatin protein 1 [Plakobranchus ocellatus]|uniref:Protein antagonist of like heterochromatin protein 1 n=1 Tax=Plakobranchus ocellatus TaxID=259542 RepID=A0AAV4AC37_9GAST|nr:protein antagonist of like heterochromatin protein 1 [Plakobranchus ocellatus]
MDLPLDDLEDLYDLYSMYRRVQRTKMKKRKRTKWVNEMNQLPIQQDAFSCLMSSLKANSDKFVDYCHMSPHLFQTLLTCVREDLTKETSNFRRPIDPELRLMLTLRHLSTGASFQSLHFEFRVGESTARMTVYDVCEAIWKKLGPKELPPQTRESLSHVAQDFFSLWQYPNCIGAVGNKCIMVKCPSNRSSHNSDSYKGKYAIVLQAVSDAKGKFIFVDVGDYDPQYDAGIFKHSAFGQALVKGQIPIPEDGTIFNSEPMPYVFIGSYTCPLMYNLMRPFPRRDTTGNNTKRLYNHHHIKARQIVERAFEKMTCRWEVLKTDLKMSPEHAKLLVLTCCVLHNYVMQEEIGECSSDVNFQEEEQLEIVRKRGDLAQQHGRPNNRALQIRNRFASIMEKGLPLPMQPQSSHII